MIAYLQGIFVRYLTKHLFNAVSERDLLKAIGKDNKGLTIISYKGKRLNPEKVVRIKDSAELFTKSDIWKVLKNEVKFQANRRMYDKSRNVSDILFGKAMLYNLEVMDNKLKELSQL